MELGISLDVNLKENVKTDFLIIGGGVAGLSAANHLADRGRSVALLEQGSYPAHKICGEFLSPEAIPILDRWEIPVSDSISRIEIITPTKQWKMQLPVRAATATRYHLDAALAKRALQKGAEIVTGAHVTKIDLPTADQPFYQVSLSTGEVWSAPSLLMSSGRLTGQGKPSFSYVGFKAHCEEVSLQQTLQMHLFKDAYVGMAPIGKEGVNIAGLIRCTSAEAENAEAFVAQFLKQKPFPKCDWRVTVVPEFGIRNTPAWPRAYFLGDAAGVIPPATGNGLSMGLTSGILAAECALKDEPDLYRTLWMKAYAKRIKNGMRLHRLFLSPLAVSLMLSAVKFMPSVARYLYRSTRNSIDAEF